MAKAPAFLFYPGDYLRDTQCLSERSQVAYDRIMCEHMRNICLTQSQLDFFTKKLTPEEKSELAFVLTKIEGGYQITWIAESISKYRAYSDSRRNNRTKKAAKEIEDVINICSTHDEHMENENESVIVNDIVEGKGGAEEKGETGFPKFPAENELYLELPEIKIGSVIQLIKISKNKLLIAEQVNEYWQVFKVQNFNGKKFYQDVSDIHSHFINWMKTQNVNDAKNNGHTSGSGGGTSGNRVAALKVWGNDAISKSSNSAGD